MRNLIGHVLQPRFCQMKSGWCSWLALFTRQRVARIAMGRVVRPSPMSHLSCLFWTRLGAIEQMVCISYLPCTSVHLVFNHSNRSPRMFEAWTCDRLQRKPHSRSWWRMGELHVSSMLLWLVEFVPCMAFSFGRTFGCFKVNSKRQQPYLSNSLSVRVITCTHSSAKYSTESDDKPKASTEGTGDNIQFRVIEVVSFLSLSTLESSPFSAASTAWHLPQDRQMLQIC